MAYDHPDEHDRSAIDFDSAATSFGDLADSTRAEIVVTLARAHYEGETQVTFSELRERLDIRDSGRFNYHLNELQPTFLEKGEDGYRLRHAGFEAYGVIIAGTYEDADVTLSGAVDHTCFVCGRQLTTDYSADRVALYCEEHGGVVDVPMPPAVIEGLEAETAAKYADNQAKSWVPKLKSGLCPFCWGAIEPRFSVPSPEETDGETLIGIVFECDRCNVGLSHLAASVVAYHPAVIAFHWEHGVDLDVGPISIHDRLLLDTQHLEEGTDTRARFTFAAEDDTLDVTLTDELEITIEG